MNIDCERFTREYFTRFEEFRILEGQCVEGRSGKPGSPKAFNLLHDMESCYAIRAYYACILIACTAIEASLSYEFGDRMRLHEKIELSGYKDDIDWLRDLRNEIVHKSETEFIKFSVFPEEASELDELCKKAFILVHEIYMVPNKNA